MLGFGLIPSIDATGSVSHQPGRQRRSTSPAMPSLLRCVGRLEINIRLSTASDWRQVFRR
ncbi:hypothetical protein VD0004_g5644 [Verticillium dahliae]|nr:hypothetical protein VD0004_g5644 [Verticillium dahliae]PNH72060.1 hypothetical protein VD0001_g5497 [Verticillium dahliae]